MQMPIGFLWTARIQGSLESGGASSRGKPLSGLARMSMASALPTMES